MLPMLQKHLSRSLADTKTLARRWLADFSKKKSLVAKVAKRAAIICLSGDLGSGKTTFVQAVASELGLKTVVASPTFVVEKVYKLPAGWPWRRLIHFDCYRLEQPTELKALGWEELQVDSANLIFLEWPERVAAALPVGSQQIKFRFIDENTRELIFYEPNKNRKK